jgi:hypothetical protein
MPRSPNETTPSQFRLRPDELARLDWLCAAMAPGVSLRRVQVLRSLIDAEYAKRGGPPRNGVALPPPPAERKKGGRKKKSSGTP